MNWWCDPCCEGDIWITHACNDRRDPDVAGMPSFTGHLGGEGQYSFNAPSSGWALMRDNSRTFSGTNLSFWNGVYFAFNLQAGQDITGLTITFNVSYETSFLPGGSPSPSLTTRVRSAYTSTVPGSTSCSTPAWKISTATEVPWVIPFPNSTTLLPGTPAAVTSPALPGLILPCTTAVDFDPAGVLSPSLGFPRCFVSVMVFVEPVDIEAGIFVTCPSDVIGGNAGHVGQAIGTCESGHSSATSSWTGTII